MALLLALSYSTAFSLFTPSPVVARSNGVSNTPVVQKGLVETGLVSDRLKQGSLAMADSAAKKIIICGAPASGKGTQCELIKETYGVVHLSTGDMLRAAVAAKTEVGLEAKGFMESGQLVPDSVMIGIILDRLAQDDCVEKGWLLDGFPRTEEQAQALEAAGIKPDKVLFLEVPDEMLIERVVGRRLDPESGKIYHLTFFPPEDEEVAARLTQRSDDTEEKVKPRLIAFHTHMSAVEACYKDLISYTDGTQKKDEVFAELQKCLNDA